MQYTESLKKNHLFRRLYHRGKSSVGQELVLYCRKNGLDHNRLGITVSTKVGNAVTRNRIRRRIREAYRLSESRYLPGWDLVVVARSSAASASWAQMRDCLAEQSEKLRLYRRS